MLKATLERSKTETRITGVAAPTTPEPPKPTLLSLSKRPPPRPSSQPLDPWGMPLELSASSTPAPSNDPWSSDNTPSLMDAAPEQFMQPSNYAIIATPSQPFSASPQPFRASPQPPPHSFAAPAAQPFAAADPWGTPPAASSSLLQPTLTAAHPPR